MRSLFSVERSVTVFLPPWWLCSWRVKRRRAPSVGTKPYWAFGLRKSLLFGVRPEELDDWPKAKAIMSGVFTVFFSIISTTESRIILFKVRALRARRSISGAKIVKKAWRSKEMGEKNKRHLCFCRFLALNWFSCRGSRSRLYARKTC